MTRIPSRIDRVCQGASLDGLTAGEDSVAGPVSDNDSGCRWSDIPEEERPPRVER